ncbi:hypothetical protein VNO77_21878 [Canavalia gladiata]|uniref:Uncharacterized protein n=1 Tax=Canavalia gladiata TaxID=3824 RepID=A0AAN9L454_CANGL
MGTYIPGCAGVGHLCSLRYCSMEMNKCAILLLHTRATSFPYVDNASCIYATRPMAKSCHKLSFTHQLLFLHALEIPLLTHELDHSIVCKIQSVHPMRQTKVKDPQETRPKMTREYDIYANSTSHMKPPYQRDTKWIGAHDPLPSNMLKLSFEPRVYEVILPSSPDPQAIQPHIVHATPNWILARRLAMPFPP